MNQAPDIHNLVICANIFVRKDGKYLLLKRSPLKKYAPNFVHPIGGKVDLNENPLIAAERELLEEAGIIVTNISLEAVILEISPHPGMQENWMIFHFSGDYASGDLLTTEEGEFISLTEQEIKNAHLFPSVAKTIDNILNPNDGTVFATFHYDEQQNIIDERSSIHIVTK